MVNVDITVSPFPFIDGHFTQMVVDGNAQWISENSRFCSYVMRKPMRKWMGAYSERIHSWKGFLSSLVNELNEYEINFRFSGTKYDYEFFSSEIQIQSSLSSETRDRIKVEFKKEIQIVSMADCLIKLLEEAYDYASVGKKIRNQLRFFRDILKNVHISIAKKEINQNILQYYIRLTHNSEMNPDSHPGSEINGYIFLLQNLNPSVEDINILVDILIKHTVSELGNTIIVVPDTVHSSDCLMNILLNAPHTNLGCIKGITYVHEGSDYSDIAENLATQIIKEQVIEEGIVLLNSIMAEEYITERADTLYRRLEEYIFS